MKTMAEVLAEHWFSPADYAYCRCGADMSPPKIAGAHEALAAHQADALVAAGYGPVREAKEAAWDECESAGYEIRLNTGSNSWGAVKDNPYRANP